MQSKWRRAGRTGGLGTVSDLKTPASKPGTEAEAAALVSSSWNSGPMTCDAAPHILGSRAVLVCMTEHEAHGRVTCSL
jgi:hypothetical protein